MTRIRAAGFVSAAVTLAACGSQGHDDGLVGPGMQPTPVYASAGGEQARAPSGDSARRPRRGRVSSASSIGTLSRDDLLDVLDAGIGLFFRRVEVEADVQDGRFVGFRLVRFQGERMWPESIDLGIGDTVTRVNGLPVEHPEQAFRVWSELRVASELRVEYVRRGERRELRYVIQE